MISSQIKTLYGQLTSTEQENLLKELNLMSHKIELSIWERPKKCVHCGSSKVIKHSIYKQTQRYKCKECNHTFIPTTGTALHHLKQKSKFLDYVELVNNEGLLTLKKVSKKLNISNQTSHDWRQKLLESIPKKNEKFEGDVQGDDLWFLYSQKGRKDLKYSRLRGGSKRKGDNNFQVKVLAMSDSVRNNYLKVVKIGRISKMDLIQNVGHKFKRKQKLISDKHSTYASFSKEKDLNHVSFISKKHKAETGENIQYINSLASGLKTEINHIHRGVSTKNLNLYCTYFAYKKQNKFVIKEILKDTEAWNRFINKENSYEIFIREKSVRTYRCPTKRTWKTQNWKVA